MAQSAEARDVLFCYKVHGFEAYYNMGDIELEKLKHLYEQTELPFINMPGEKLTEAEYVYLAQSNQVRMAVTADVDNNEWTEYEINGIPENERTDLNTDIRTSALDGNENPEDELFVDEKELHPVYQAKGWERFEDGSGRLIDIHGKTLVSFDLATKELMGNNLPFTNHKLYMNYSYDNCSFEIMKRDAVRWLNYNYKSALERANEIAEQYYFKVSETENPEYPFNVEKINNGRCGFGKLCKNVDEVKEFIETCERKISECAPNELITEEMDINELKQLADDLMLESPMQGMDLEM